MNKGLYSAIGAMRAAERRIDITAHNLANLSTNGFKRKDATHRTFRVLTDSGERRSVGTRGTTNWSQGPVDRTGYPFHLSLRGPGFFAVESPEGETYTRDGQFEVDANGELVTHDGFPVAWDERLAAYSASGPDPVVEPNGEVYQGTNRLGRLRVVDFEDYERLTEASEGYWIPQPGARVTNAAAEIAQGELELSNATGIDEMVELIANQRAYELAARAVQQIDESYQRLNRPS